MTGKIEKIVCGGKEYKTKPTEIITEYPYVDDLCLSGKEYQVELEDPKTGDIFIMTGVVVGTKRVKK